MGAKHLMVLFVLCLACHITVAGIFEPVYLGCKCLRVTSQIMHPSKFAKVEIFPYGLACNKVEIIITLKTGTKVCVDPQAKWMLTLLKTLRTRRVK